MEGVLIFNYRYDHNPCGNHAVTAMHLGDKNDFVFKGRCSIKSKYRFCKSERCETHEMRQQH